MTSSIWRRAGAGVALSVGLVAAPVIALPSAAQELDAGPGETELNFLGINDFHGRINEDTVLFAGTVEEQKAANPEGTTAFISAGDNIGASLFASATQEDKPTIDVLNALGLQASAVGNHEFDAGIDNLTGQISDWADFPYLGANVYAAGTQNPVLDEYALFELNGMNVAVIGAVTQETPSLVTPSGIAGLEFGDPVEAVNRVATELENSGDADVIIAAYHEGAAFGTDVGYTFDQAVADGGAFANIVNNTSAAVDAMFTGHTHAQYVWDAPVPGSNSDTRPVIQTGSYGEFVGEIELIVDDEGNVTEYAASNHPITDTAVEDLIAAYPAVAEVNTIVNDALAVAEEIGGQPVGEVTADITTAFAGPEGALARDDRGSQSALGNLVADALVETLRPERLGGAEIGVTNPGGLRAELCDSVAGEPSPPGDLCNGGSDGVITFAEANAVLPFVNNLWTTTLTGAQFKTLLEQQWQPESSSTPFLALGLSENVSYTYDPELPEGERILSIAVNGEPVDPQAEYRIGTFSFLAQGGDNFSVFTEGANTQDSGLIDRDAWIDYLKANSPVSPDFSQRGIIVQGAPSSVDVGDEVTFEVSNLDSASLGAPQIEELEVAFLDAEGNAEVVTKETVSNGTATVSFTVPSNAADSATLMLSANPTNTEAFIPVAVTGTGGGDGVSEGGDDGASADEPERNDGLNVDTAAAEPLQEWIPAAIAALIAVLALGSLWLRRKA